MTRKRATPKKRGARSTNDDGVFIPSSFVLPSSVVAPAVESDVFIPPTFGQRPSATDVVRQKMEYAKVEAYDMIGLDSRGNCKYGCGGMASLTVEGLAAHRYNCPYWDREGKDRTPF